MSGAVEFVVNGKSEALQNLHAQRLNVAAYLGFQEQFFAELGITAVEASTKNAGKHDGRTEALASLGDLPRPAGAKLAATEIALG